MPESPLHEPLLRWYDEHARVLPWRQPDVGAWAVLVSEIMLQQTPVRRVLAGYERWMGRWPTPSALAADSPGEAIRCWGRLGYPRRALRLHAAATVIDERHGGEVPADEAALLALPGVGPYTAAAVLAFAFGVRAIVLDTNCRRVISRVTGAAEPRPTGGVSAAERAAARALLPDGDADSARWNVAVMELGALVCTAGSPDCARCPVADACEWHRAGHPQTGRAGRIQRYVGTDRQCRGAILAALRAHDTPVRADHVAADWPDAAQRDRALASLVGDGLVVVRGEGPWAVLSLPG